jgi:hypothetical protein
VIPDKVVGGAEYEEHDGRIIKRETVKSPDSMGNDMAQMSVQSNFELIP